MLSVMCCDVAYFAAGWCAMMCCAVVSFGVLRFGVRLCDFI